MEMDVPLTTLLPGPVWAKIRGRHISAFHMKHFNPLFMNAPQ